MVYIYETDNEQVKFSPRSGFGVKDKDDVFKVFTNRYRKRIVAVNDLDRDYSSLNTRPMDTI